MDLCVRAGMRRQTGDALESLAGACVRIQDLKNIVRSDTVLRNAIQKSVRGFLSMLAISCTSISGETDSINGATDEHMYVAMNHISEELTNVIFSGHGHGVKLCRVCEFMYECHASKAVELHKSYLSKCMDGISVLATLAASSSRVDQVANALACRPNDLSLIKSVLWDPPTAFLECMAAHGIANTPLNVLWDGATPCVVPADCLRRSCIDALVVLRKQLHEPVGSTAWSQIQLGKVPDDTTSDDACFVVNPPHAAREQSVLIKRPPRPTGTGALRVVRFVKALQICALQLGTSGESWSNIDVDYVLSAQQSVGSKCVACEPSDWIAPKGMDVPRELKRDFNILLALQRCIPVGSGLVNVECVACDLLRSDTCLLENSTQRSVEQAVHHVMRKCAYQASKQADGARGIEYVKSGLPGCTLGHLKLDAAGSARLRIRIREVITCMVSDSRKIRSEWKASRSSRMMASAARRTQ